MTETKQLAADIVDALLTRNWGDEDARRGTRLAIRYHPNANDYGGGGTAEEEEDLGGLCRASAIARAEAVLRGADGTVKK